MERAVGVIGRGEGRKYERIGRARMIGSARSADKEPSLAVRSIPRSTSAN